MEGWPECLQETEQRSVPGDHGRLRGGDLPGAIRLRPGKTSRILLTIPFDIQALVKVSE